MRQAAKYLLQKQGNLQEESRDETVFLMLVTCRSDHGHTGVCPDQTDELLDRQEFP